MIIKKQGLPAAISLALLGVVSQPLQAQETVIASDMVGSTSSNLIAFYNPYTNAFASPGDGFQKYQRNVSGSIPYSVLDDSLRSYPADKFGLVDDDNLDEFFALTDTVNSQASGPVSASWEFAIGGESQLGLLVDIAAMGDFESADFIELTARVDDGAEQVLLRSEADEAGSQLYVLAGGTTVNLDDPMTVDGQVLTNTFTQQRMAIAGTGSRLTITLTSQVDGGSEALALQNMQVVTGFADSAPVGPQEVAIHTIQGNAEVSPLAGEMVRIEGVVVGDFQNNASEDNGDLGGFFVQSLVADADPATSEGLFVYDGNSPENDVAIGDKVVIEGKVSEFRGMTQISATSIATLASDWPLPQATEITLPLDSNQALEAVEGMRVTLPQALSISEAYNFDRYGEWQLALPLDEESRLITPTSVEAPGSNGFEARLTANALRAILIDDGRTSQNPDPAIHPNGQPFTQDNRFRLGDTVTNVVGVVNEAFGAHRIQPTQGAEYQVTNPRLPAPDVSGQLTVASFNVLNYFTTLDEQGNRCGPNASSCRGADNAEEFTRQRAKIITAIAQMNADVVGLIEIENNPQVSLQDLTDGINAALGRKVYKYVDTGTIGTDAIKVGLLYKPWKLALRGDHAVLDSSVDSRFIDQLNRPALVQTFKERWRGGVVSVAVNHFKSKGSNCNDYGDVDMQDGQGNCNGVRTDAANALADWLATDPTNSGDPDVLIIGDLNSYAQEDPIMALQQAGYSDLVANVPAPAYTYSFSGQVGYLDHALASPVLSQQVRDVQVWHINADEPDILDYDTSYKKDAQAALYMPDAYRSSDHDPVLVGLKLNVVPEKWYHCKFGIWRKLSRHDGSRFKNQGQCIRFVKTGR